MVVLWGCAVAGAPEVPLEHLQPSNAPIRDPEVCRHSPHTGTDYRCGFVFGSEAADFLTQLGIAGGFRIALAVGIVEEHALVHQGPVLVVAATG